MSKIITPIRSRSPRCRRGAFTLMEMLVALTMLLVVLDLSSRLFRTGMQSMQKTQAIDAKQRQIDSALSALGDDVWRSTRLDIIERSVKIGIAGEIAVVWQINSDGSIDRNEVAAVADAANPSSAARSTHWQAAANDWSFSRASDSLVLTMPRPAVLSGRDQVRFVSQILAASR